MQWLFCIVVRVFTIVRTQTVETAQTPAPCSGGKLQRAAELHCQHKIQHSSYEKNQEKAFLLSGK
jgi:hypothetical protein